MAMFYSSVVEYHVIQCLSVSAMESWLVCPFAVDISVKIVPIINKHLRSNKGYYI